MAKNPPANEGDVGDMGSITGSERFLEEGNGSPLQYYSLENLMDRRALYVCERVCVCVCVCVCVQLLSLKDTLECILYKNIKITFTFKLSFLENVIHLDTKQKEYIHII